MAETFEAHPFNCAKCGGQLNLYVPDESTTVVCSHCGSILDVTSENGQLLSTYRAKISGKPKPVIPLGSRGNLRGEDVIVIGFIVRKIEVDLIPFRWREYLLYNPTNGFRWLTEYDGHWTYVRTVTDIPKVGNSSFAGQEIQHRNLTYKHFQTAEAQVEYVLGEFYWKIAVGEKAKVEDYISPPFLLSSEKTPKEISWSLGLYIEPAEVWAAFKVPTPVVPRTGIFANQPNPYETFIGRGRVLAIAFSAAAIVLYAFLSGIAQNKRVYSQEFAYARQDIEKSRITEFFNLEGHTSNAKIHIGTNLDNGWCYFGMALINTRTNEAIDFGKEVGYFHGHDVDGAWSEGKTHGSVYVPSLESGEYYLRIEPDASVPNMNYVVEVTRDVPRASYLFWVLMLLIIPQVYAEFCNYSFEMKRWGESDHPWVTEAEDEE